MTHPLWSELPFDERPDLTPFLIHLTRTTEEGGVSAFDNLLSILQTGQIKGSRKGFIKGAHPAACFMDIPFSSLKYLLTDKKRDDGMLRYEPYGIFIKKELAYHQGVRPVFYLSETETERLQLPEQELWRVVRFEETDDGWINWLHEREWRGQGDFALAEIPVGVLVKDPKVEQKLRQKIKENPHAFGVDTEKLVILPLSIICQGLPYLNTE